jgi:membrane protein involved in colicin uptake
MSETLENIEQALAQRALELEQQRMKAHEEAMKEIAAARVAEEERQRKVQEEVNAQDARTRAKKAAEKAAIEEAFKAEQELQRAREQEQNKKQEEIEKMVARKEALDKKLRDLEHAEEAAKKELHDIMLRSLPCVDTERIMSNPLERFFQKSE